MEKTKSKEWGIRTIWAIIVVIVAVNAVLLVGLKRKTLSDMPLESLNITKPTLVVIMDENECAACVKRLMALNDLYTYIKEEGRIDFRGVILSHTKKDPKQLKRAFIFPVEISDDFRILYRLKMNRTPMIIGLSADHRILYSELVPWEAGVTVDYLKSGVLNRLYYSLQFREEKPDGVSK